MCIDCAKRRLRELEREHPRGEAGWFLCIADHGDHIHIRMNGSGEHGGDAGAWTQVPVARAPFEALLPRGTRLHIHERDSTTGHGCSPALLDSIHSVVLPSIADADAADKAGPDDLCPVCFDTFSPGDQLAVLPCSHRYHMACVRPWLAKATTCPACRLEVTEEAVSAQKGIFGGSEIPAAAASVDAASAVGDPRRTTVTPDTRSAATRFPSIAGAARAGQEQDRRSGSGSGSETQTRRRTWRNAFVRRPAATRLNPGS